MDAEIGRLVDRVDQLGLANETLIIFASDNGPECIFLRTSSHSGIGSPGPFRGKKRSLYEGGIRVPLIVRWPGQTPAGVVDNTSVVAAVDFLPTFAALAGTPYVAASIEPREVVGFETSATYRLYVPPLPPDGEDISDVLMGTPRPRNTPLFWEYRLGQTELRTIDRSPRVAVRDGNWKLLLNPDGSRVELYDVVVDPGESLDVSGLNPEIVATMTTMAMDWLAELPPGPVFGQAGKAQYPWP